MYHDLYDLPRAFPLSAPNVEEPVYRHGGNISLLYIVYLEYGLQLPLHHFISDFCVTLGVSPSQFTPNVIGVLVGFLVICHRVGVEPTMCLLGNLISVKSTTKDPHYFLHYIGGTKLVADAPVSNRDWKERYVWVFGVFGADVVLSCPTWPEVNKDELKVCVLTAEERRQLEKIRSYAGSRKRGNLFEMASL